MLRQLLTLLAIFTGLAAVCEPAQARTPGIEQVRLQADTQLIVSCVIRAGSGSHQLSRAGKAASAQPQKPRCMPVIVPRVMLGADRAHE
ncbi:hypothetical protein [Altericroceibacterium xinjiangense]|uniref:hypothetical protein n=1 Tax=Altericroceibacterium xinjiangense TaxID=762261 RepID=UPI000F7E2A66|nr:hypothetical protein [Altericroceibacterium xinjiangense]